jgi:hypothetical protein
MALVLGVATGPVVGQGSNGLVADPMGIEEAREFLERYASLEKAQWPIVEQAHDEYLEAFSTLRDGPVQRFLDESEKVMAVSSGRMPEPKAVKELFDRGVRINQRIASVDDAFFQKLISSLAEHQVPGIFRAKTARKRARNSSGQMGLMGGIGRLPIDSAYWKLDLAPETRAMIDPDLRTYENTMATLSAKRLIEANRSILNMTEAMTDAGFGDITSDDMQDPERLAEVMEVVQEAMATSMVKLAELQGEINERNTSFARRLRQSLSLEEGHELMQRWVGRGGLLTALSGSASSIPTLAKKILALKDITGDQVEAVESVVRNWRRRDVKHLVDLSDAELALSMGNFSGEMMSPERLDGGFQEVLERNEARRADEARSRESLEAIIGPERFAAIEKATAPSSGVSMPTGVSMFASSAGGIGDSTMHISSMSVDGAGFGSANTLVPGALPTIDLPLIGELIGLSAGEQEILRVVHAAYLKEWKRRVTEPVKKADGMSPWEMADGEAQPTYNKSVHAEKWAILERSFEHSLALDETLFSDVAATMSGTERAASVNAAIQFRSFQRLEGGGGGSSLGFLSIGALQLPNPYRLFDGLKLDDAQRDSVFAQVLAHHDVFASAIEGLQQQRFAAARKAAELEQEMFIGIDSESDNGAVAAFGGMDFEEQLKVERRSMRDMARRVATIRAIIEKDVISGLEDLVQLEAQVDMLDQIIASENVSLDVVRRIRRMGDITPGQRASINAIFEEHLRKDAAFAASMLDLRIKPVTVGDSGEGLQAAFQERTVIQQKVERIDFQRNELERRLLDRIAAILTPEQNIRIPALAD